MTYRDAVREFKRSHRYLWEMGADYWTAQLEWAIYTDNLCKEGLITEKQWNTWQTPFTYGKPLKLKVTYSA